MEDFKSFFFNFGYRFFEYGVIGYRILLGDYVYIVFDDFFEVIMELYNECLYLFFFFKKVYVKFFWYLGIFIKGQVIGEFIGSDIDLIIWRNMFIE